MRDRALIPLAAAVAIVAGAIALLWPYATEDRDIVVATPAPAGLFDRTTTRLPSGEQACIAPVTFPEDAGFVQVVAYVKEGAPQPLEIRALATDLNASTTVSDYIVGQDAVLRAPLPAPAGPRPRGATTGRVCIRNRGRLAVALVGTSEPRSLSLASPSLAGAEVGGRTIALSLIRREPQSILDRADDAVSHASDWTGGLAPEFLLWILLVVATLGIPAGTILALAFGARD